MFRSSSFRVAQVLLLLLPAVCVGQGISANRQTNCAIQVRVAYEDERAAADQIRVELLNDSDTPIFDTFTDSNGRATLRVTAPGMYRVQVSGTPIQGTSSTSFTVEDMDKSKTVFVHVKPKTDATSAVTTKSGSQQVTSAAELRIPADAKKAFHKGMEAWGRNEYAKAAEQFEKAIAIYPQYESAYNNLGVMYYQMNQPEKARAAFEKSVALNDKNADADRNLARILLHDGNFTRAEDLLKKSLMVEPLNPVTLMLLCIAEIQTGDDDGALVTARKVHQLPHEGCSVVHYVAGQVYEHKGQPQNAYDEYETYLHETPEGPEASQVRNALARVIAGSRPSSQ